MAGLEKWGSKYLYAVRSWKTNWPLLATFFKYPPEIRRLIYTTNPIENFHRQLRKITKTKGSFPTDDSLFKILYLAVMEAQENGRSPCRMGPNTHTANRLLPRHESRHVYRNETYNMLAFRVSTKFVTLRKNTSWTSLPPYLRC